MIFIWRSLHTYRITCTGYFYNRYSLYSRLVKELVGIEQLHILIQCLVYRRMATSYYQSQHFITTTSCSGNGVTGNEADVISQFAARHVWTPAQKSLTKKSFSMGEDASVSWRCLYLEYVWLATRASHNFPWQYPKDLENRVVRRNVCNFVRQLIRRLL